MPAASARGQNWCLLGLPAPESLTVFEIELKFQVPAAARDAVRRAVGTASARQQRLRAQYLDTPDRRLARARAALRLRDEGAHWVQTFKAEGENPMLRLEHEVVLPASDAPPAPDLARHQGTPAATALARALGLEVLAGDGQAQGLGLHFETDIQRLKRVVRVPGGLVELALDEGWIRAGGREWPVCELEFELVRGEPAVLLELARRWVTRHGLWLDVRSKAERGHLLARGQWASPPTRGEAPALRKRLSPEQGLQRLLRSALTQVLANGAVLADADLPALPEAAEYLHQCRIGLRRLRTVLRTLPLPATATRRPEATWEPLLGEVFRGLGVQRDHDALVQAVLPGLQAAGAPWTEVLSAPPAGAPSAGERLRSPGFNTLLLDLLGFVQTPLAPSTPEAAVAPAPSLRRWLRTGLAPLQQQVQEDARQYAQLDDAASHRLRRRIKRLRYALEMSASLWPAKALARQLAVLGQAQDALGHDHDLVLAQALFREAAAREPQAWWAVGWLQAQRGPQQALCAQVLRTLARTAAAFD